MNSIPAIGQITDPKKTRVALVQGQQIVSAPATALSDAVGLPSGGSTGQVLTKSSGTDYDTEWANTGNFSGPASAVDGNLVAFDGTTGKLGKDSGKKPADFATAAQGAKADTAVQPSAVRELLTANRTYYVSTTGSDSNDGLASGTAFRTRQKALNVVLGTLDLGGFNVTIQLAAGTYTDALSFASPQVGAGNITLSGDTTTPSNCFINSTGVGTCVTVDGGGCRLFVQGIKFSGQPTALLAQNGGYIKTTGKNEFSTCTGHIIQAMKGGIIDAVAPEIVSGSAAGGHYMATMGGVVYCQTATWAISTGASRGAFAWAQVLGTIYAFANTFTGTLTGSRYTSTTNSVINSNGGGASYFPGSTAGATATGGQYA